MFTTNLDRSAWVTCLTVSPRPMPVECNPGTKTGMKSAIASISLCPFPHTLHLLTRKLTVLFCACFNQELTATSLSSTFHVQQRAFEAFPKFPWTRSSRELTSHGSRQRATLRVVHPDENHTQSHLLLSIYHLQSMFQTPLSQPTVMSSIHSPCYFWGRSANPSKLPWHASTTTSSNIICCSFLCILSLLVCTGV